MQTFDFASAPIDEISEVVTTEFNICTQWTGIRIFDAETEPKFGDNLEASRVWEDNELTEETLDGTCAVQIDWQESDLITEINYALKIAKQYCGDYVAIIGGETATYGEDRHEVIIRNAVILKVWKLN